MVDKVIEKKVDELKVEVYSDRKTMGEKAGEHIICSMNKVIEKKGKVRMVFAAAPSQNEVLETLKNTDKVDWSKVEAFHMDEYIGLSKDAPQGFGNYLNDHLFNHIPLKEVHLLNQRNLTITEEIERYSRLLLQDEIDIVCLGIGENGHIAFNDPPVADFKDKEIVKVVTLDEICRQQQVNDGCFETLKDVPQQAFTLTVPILFNGKELFCVVPGCTKRDAVRRMLTEDISEQCPASILRRHKNCTLYLDQESYYEM